MYMAPEVHDKTVPYQGQDVDVFAFGVAILIAKIMEYPWKKRPDRFGGGNYELLVDDNGTKADKFWDSYPNHTFTEEFKSLIENMLAFNPTSRATIVDILGHEWMRGEVITQ